jgi:hypothetical protein
MARKLLTALDQIEATALITFEAIKEEIAVQEEAEEMMVETIHLRDYTAGFHFLNVQKLMIAVHAIETFNKTTMLPPEQRQQIVTNLLRTPLEEDIAVLKRRIPLRQEHEQQTYRRTQTRLQRYLHPIEERLLPEIALRLIDHTALCLMDKYLYETYPIETTQIVQQLVKACEAKTTRVQPLLGYEALQKQIMQLYLYPLMTHPFTLNLTALRITALTMSALLHKAATLYMVGANQAQAIKPKSLMQPCTKQRLETKHVASGKTITEAVPEKFSVADTDDLTEDTDVNEPKNLFGQEGIFLSLRYAYGMPYKIRRLIAIHMGMPENHKYALYFGIGGLPTRRSTQRFTQRKYSEAAMLNYSRDQYVMKAIQQYNTRRASFYARYGKYYRKRRL